MAGKKKKKKKKIVKVHSERKHESVEIPKGNLQVAKPSPIGIIGWNQSSFIESQSSFVEAIRKTISIQGASSLYFGISGGADVLTGFKENGYKRQDTDTSKIVKKESGQGLQSNYCLPSRDLVADQIEILVHQEHLSGLIMVPWSVSSLVGMMMATIRCGVPTLFLPHYRSWPVLSQISQAHGGKKEKSPALSYAQCSMMVLLEVFGLTKLGIFERIFSKKGKEFGTFDSPEALTDRSDIEFAEWGARRMMEMSKQKISPRRFFSQSAFHNAMCADMSLGSSAESILHLNALAVESGIALSPVFFNEGAKKFFQLVPMDRSGEFSMEDFEKSGGIHSLLGALRSALQASPMVVGRNMVEVSREFESGRSMFKPNRPQKKHGGLGILSGNLARDGALFRVAGLKDQQMSSSGAARVFDSEEACVNAVLSKKVKKGEVLVIRYCGPKGNPGMPSLDAVSHAIADKGLSDSVAIVTDGRLNQCGRTPAFVHVSPEAAVGSTLSILQDGDVVTWNFFDRTLLVRLTDTEIKVRLSRWIEQEKNMKNSFLYRYSKYSSSSSFGATLI